MERCLCSPQGEGHNHVMDLQKIETSLVKEEIWRSNTQVDEDSVERRVGSNEEMPVVQPP